MMECAERKELMDKMDWLSGPLRMSMILSAEGKHEAARAMLERHKRETMERPKAEDVSQKEGNDEKP